jgi:hypothetical protein
MTEWWTDPRMLAAGNARGMAGGDPDALTASPTAGAVAGSTHVRPAVAVPDYGKLPGDLDAHAERLDVDVADLVAARRAEPTNVLGKLFDAIGRWAR